MKITLKRSFMAVLCVVGMSSFVACDEDDDVLTPPVFNPTAENGSYTGTMSFEADDVVNPLAIIETAVAFEATQNSIGQDSIVFAEFPVEGLITAVVGEALAPDIITLVGKVRYAVPFSATESKDKKEVSITLKPTTLELPAAAVKVFVSSPATPKGNFVVETGIMTYTLVADSVYMAGQKMEFTPMTLSFEGTKKK